jgi:hypothetical protein
VVGEFEVERIVVAVRRRVELFVNIVGNVFIYILEVDAVKVEITVTAGVEFTVTIGVDITIVVGDVTVAVFLVKKSFRCPGSLSCQMLNRKETWKILV